MYVNSTRIWIDAQKTSQGKWDPPRPACGMGGKGGGVEAQIPLQNLKIY